MSFFFVGHGFGVLSEEYDFSLVPERTPDPKSRQTIARGLSAFGKPKWFGPWANWCIESAKLKAGIRSDPTWTDSPELLEDPAMYAEFGLDRDRLSGNQQRLLAYEWMRDQALAAVHEKVPLALVVARRRRGAKLGARHDLAAAELLQVVRIVRALYETPELRALIDVHQYRRRNYYSSPAKLMVDVLAMLLPSAVVVAAVGPLGCTEISEALDAALGFSSITDSQLLGFRAHLTADEEVPERVPEPVRAAFLKYASGEPFPPW